MKAYKIPNPNVKRQLVRLTDEQDLRISVPKDVYVNSKCTYLRETSNTIVGSNLNLTLTPVDGIAKFSNLTTHCLGEIFIGDYASIIVLLQGKKCANKNNVTLINPFAESVRVRPYDVIEVMYCSDCDSKLRWFWEPTDVDIDVVEIAYRKSVAGREPLYSNSGESYYPHPRNIFPEGKTIHHYWFRPERGLLSALDQYSDRGVYVGKLSIEGKHPTTGDVEEANVDIYCDLLSKWKTKTLEAQRKIAAASSKTSCYNNKSWQYNLNNDNTTTTTTTKGKGGVVTYITNKQHTVDLEVVESDCLYEDCNKIYVVEVDDKKIQMREEAKKEVKEEVVGQNHIGFYCD